MQPNPVKNDYKFVVDELIEDLKKRKELGIERYGTALQPFNGRNALQDAMEEFTDLLIYFKQYMMEQEEKERDSNVKS